MRGRAETASLPAALPPKFVARKHLCRRAAEWVVEYIYDRYYDEHRDQIASTLAAARSI